MWLSRVDVSIDKCVIQSSLLSGFPFHLGFKFMGGKKKKIMAQHGAWRELRERCRTLEAEGSALAETLRNLVASNATLKAKYAAELRALTKEDFTIGADVVARWNNY
jgi:hypothetical protein